MAEATEQQFSGWRGCIWPIHRHELPKMLPMLAMVFLVCFNYSVLRCMKDTLVITSAGAVVIPFIKVWVMLPAALLLTLLFTWMSNRYSQERVFYWITSGFLAAFLIFAFVLYPCHEAIHPVRLSESLMEHVPEGFRGFVSMCCYWSFTLFYVLSELWGSLVMSVLFWGFANEVTRIHEAKRFYSIFSIGSNIAAIMAGQVANLLTCRGAPSPYIPYGANGWEQTVMSLVLLITLSGLLTMAAFRWMNRNVLNREEFADLHKVRAKTAAKPKLSMKDSFAYLANSKYLLCIAILVIAYNLTINLAEVVWKDQLSVLYPSATECSRYLANITSITGIVSTMIAFFMVHIISRFGWTKIAALTPLTMFATCTGFFFFYIFHEQLEPLTLVMTGMTPLMLSVYFGAAQNCLSKGMKYSVFDATKEMTFIPLEHEYKLKGKAAIDGVGSRFGKSGGSLIHQGLLFFFGTLGACAPYVACIIFGVIAIWFIAVRALGDQFGALISSQGGGELFTPEENAQPVTELSKV